MSEYNRDNISFVPTQEVMTWKGKHVVAKTSEGIEVEGVVSKIVVPGPTRSPSEWLGVIIEGGITLSPGVIERINIVEN